MTKLLALVLLVSTLALPAAAKDRFNVLHVSGLAAELKMDDKPAVYDANTEEVRRKYGVIPGAVLLQHGETVANQLPRDKHRALVFYCFNPKCLASHQAANKAIAAGYTDVSVMVDGISGWKKAGQPTSAPKSDPS